MKIVIAHILLLLSLSSAAQKTNFNSTRQLAQFINMQYPDSSQKILQAYKWVTTNMRYDATGALAINHGADRRAVIDVAFAKRRGVCENFAAIFSDICLEMGFESVVVEGLTRQHSHIDRQGHSWVALKKGNEWFLFDPTWDKGLKDNFRYFSQPGKVFIETHFPFDPLWQMIEHTVHYADFRDMRYAGNDRPFFNYKDSIAHFLSLDSLGQLTAKVSRMEQVGISNNISRTFYKIAKGDLEGEKQEQQMQWYNAASKLLNECTVQLNEFIQYRNNRFLPVKPDSQMAAMLHGIPEKISTAFHYFDKVDGSDAILVYGTEPIREQAKKLNDSFKKQKEFLQKYLAASVTERSAVFYQ